MQRERYVIRRHLTAASGWAPALWKIQRGLLAVLIAIASLSAYSTGPNEGPASVERIDVTGFAPGPSILKATKGEKVVWILPLYAPLRRDQPWSAEETRSRIDSVSTVLAPPRVGITTSGLGVFGGISAGFQALGLKYLPEGKQLSDVVEPELHARWVSARDRYVRSATSQAEELEKLRPVFAASKLVDEWGTTNGLEVSPATWGQISKLAQELKKSVVRSDVSLPFPKGSKVDAGTGVTAEEKRCLDLTLQLVERGHLSAYQESKKWAEGSLSLSEASLATSRQIECEKAYRSLWGNEGSRWSEEASAKLRESWLSTVKQALLAAPSAFAVVNYRDLYSGGLIDHIRADGFSVSLPE